ncbi:HAD family hydrolase [Nocardioides sp. SYSU DS0663]|uniref:HAD family hydrolase n=1 Tax=Nocardioides sp. SYSU DS0663 TaxID=3416445 RepID=UPI003F4BDC0B
MSQPTGRRPDTVVLDLDGTLVDSVYVHVACWKAAFRDVGIDVPAHRLHRAIGMGGDRLVTAVSNESVERSVGDELRARHGQHIDAHFHEITVLEGAGDLLEALRDAGLDVVLASSGEREQTDRLLDLVPGAHLIQETVSGSEAEESKPAPDLLAASLARVDATRSFAVGDSVWDAKAAAAAGIPVVGFLTGGFSTAELRDAGAALVHDGPAALAAALDEVLETLRRQA